MPQLTECFLELTTVLKIEAWKPTNNNSAYLWMNKYLWNLTLDPASTALMSWHAAMALKKEMKLHRHNFNHCWNLIKMWAGLQVPMWLVFQR